MISIFFVNNWAIFNNYAPKSSCIIFLVCRKQILKIGLFLLMNCKMFGNGNDAEKRLGKENRNLSQELICKTYGEKEEKIST